MLPTISTFCKLYQCGDKLLFEYIPNTSIYSYTTGGVTTYYSIDPSTTVTISISRDYGTETDTLPLITLDVNTTTSILEGDIRDCRYTFTIAVSYIFTVYTDILPDDIIVLEEEPKILENTEISLDYTYNHLPVIFGKLISLMKDVICNCKTSNCKCSCGPSCQELISYTYLLNYYDILFEENFKYILSLYNQYQNNEDNFLVIKDLSYDISVYGLTNATGLVKQLFLQKYIKYYTIEKILFNTGFDYFNNITTEDLGEDYIEDKFSFTQIESCIRKIGVTIEEPLNLNYKFNLLESTTFSTQYNILFNSLIDSIIALTVATPSGQSSTPLNAEDLENLKI